VKNCVAIGLSSAFVEPLESTTLHMVIMEIAYLIAGLQQRDGDRAAYRTFANEKLGAHWDDLRWLLGVHYKFNRKKETAFWRDCRETVDVSGIAPLLEHFGRVGPLPNAEKLLPFDPTFLPGLMILLLGQQVPCPRPAVTALPKAAWDARVAESRALVDRAWTQADALDLLRRRPELLAELVTSESSWVTSGGERITGVDPVRGILHPQRKKRPNPGPYVHLLEGIESTGAPAAGTPPIDPTPSPAT